MVRRWVLGVTCAGALYGFWPLFQPPQVDAVHLSHGRPRWALVQHFPLTQQGKIEWWDRNKAMLKAKYGVSYEDYRTLAFMEWDGTYRIDRGTEEDSDLLCFEDMDTQANCIEKGTVIMLVNSQSDGRSQFTVEGPTGEATYVRAPGSDALRRLPD